jgi:Ca2+-binding RTX toxin-like protein
MGGVDRGCPHRVVRGRGGASPASAATIYTRASGCNPGPCTDSDYVYAGSGSEWNNVLVTQSGGNYDFLEMAPSTTITFPDPRCTQLSSQEVTCPIVPDSDGLTWDADAELHGGDDQIDMRTTRPSRIEGGGGSDVLKGSSSDDVIAGDEDFPNPPPPDGNDFIDGRGGADHMVGDGGTDTVSYISRSTPVNASLDGVANDGGSGEGDNIEGDVEILSGSHGNDTLTGNAGPNTLRGNSGNNDLNGLDGNDTLQGGDGTDTLDGGAGADDEAGGPGIDIADYTAATVPVSVNARSTPTSAARARAMTTSTRTSRT